MMPRGTIKHRNKMALKDYFAMTSQPKTNKFRVASIERRIWKGFWNWDQEILFASEGEMLRFQQLVLYEKAGKILDLRLQPRFVVRPSFIAASGKMIKAEYYQGDFSYIEQVYVKDHSVLASESIEACFDRKWVCEDFKGVETSIFKRKFKLVKEMHTQVEFRLITREDLG